MGSVVTFVCSLPQIRLVEVLDGWMVSCLNNPFCGPDSSLKSVLVLFGSKSKPARDGAAENRLDNGGVEHGQHLLRQIKELFSSSASQGLLTSREDGLL